MLPPGVFQPLPFAGFPGLRIGGFYALSVIGRGFANEVGASMACEDEFLVDTTLGRGGIHEGEETVVSVVGFRIVPLHAERCPRWETADEPPFGLETSGEELFFAHGIAGTPKFGDIRVHFAVSGGFKTVDVEKTNGDRGSILQGDANRISVDHFSHRGILRYPCPPERGHAHKKQKDDTRHKASLLVYFLLYYSLE